MSIRSLNSSAEEIANSFTHAAADAFDPAAATNKVFSIARSKFFASSSDDSESESSLSSSSEVELSKAVAKTPIDEFDEVIKESSPECSFMKEEQNTVGAALDYIENLPPAEKNNSAKRFLKTLFKKIAGGSTTPPLGSPTTHRKLSESLLDSPWAGGLTNKLRKSLSLEDVENKPLLNPIANMKHIVEGETAGGRHFCPANSPARQDLEIIQTNSANGVFCASFKTEKKVKISSFYPDSIKSEQALVEILMQSHEIARRGDTSLRDTGKGFLIEVFLKKGGLIYHSAFPIFFFASYEKDKEFAITKTFTLNSEESLKIAKKALQETASKPENEKAERYQLENGKKIIVDIAPFLAELKIPHGIFFLFSASDLQ